MSTLASSQGPHLAGVQALWYAPASALTDLPDVDGLSLLGNLVLAGTAVWGELLGTIYTPTLDVDAVATAHGPGYDFELSGFLTGEQATVATSFGTMQGRRFVLLYRDYEGTVRLVGDPSGGLEFSYKQGTGSKPGEKKGYTWRFKGRTGSPALFYTGTLPAGSTGGSVVSAGSPVRVYTSKGRYLGQAQPGQKIIITSPFRATIQIV